MREQYYLTSFFLCALVAGSCALFAYDNSTSPPEFFIGFLLSTIACLLIAVSWARWVKTFHIIPPPSGNSRRIFNWKNNRASKSIRTNCMFIFYAFWVAAWSLMVFGKWWVSPWIAVPTGICIAFAYFCKKLFQLIIQGPLYLTNIKLRWALREIVGRKQDDPVDRVGNYHTALTILNDLLNDKNLPQKSDLYQKASNILARLQVRVKIIAISANYQHINLGKIAALCQCEESGARAILIDLLKSCIISGNLFEETNEIEFNTKQNALVVDAFWKIGDMGQFINQILQKNPSDPR